MTHDSIVNWAARPWESPRSIWWSSRPAWVRSIPGHHGTRITYISYSQVVWDVGQEFGYLLEEKSQQYVYCKCVCKWGDMHSWLISFLITAIGPPISRKVAGKCLSTLQRSHIVVCDVVTTIPQNIQQIWLMHRSILLCLVRLGFGGLWLLGFFGFFTPWTISIRPLLPLVCPALALLAGGRLHLDVPQGGPFGRTNQVGLSYCVWI